MTFLKFTPNELSRLRGEMSLAALASESGIPLGTLTKLERGDRCPRLDTLRKLGKFFGVHFY